MGKGNKLKQVLAILIVIIWIGLIMVSGSYNSNSYDKATPIFKGYYVKNGMDSYSFAQAE